MESLRLPSPKPSTERKTPRSRFCSISRTRSPWLVTPTLKSPSVARMTRLTPPSMNVLGARCRRRAGCRRRRWSSRRPAACRAPRWISGLAIAGRGRQHEPAGAGVDDDRDAVARGERVDEQPHARPSRAAAVRAASSSPTRRAGRRGCAAASLPDRPARAWRPMSASRCRGFHGHGRDLASRRRTAPRRRARRRRSGSS